MEIALYFSKQSKRLIGDTSFETNRKWQPKQPSKPACCSVILSLQCINYVSEPEYTQHWKLLRRYQLVCEKRMIFMHVCM